MRFKVRLDLYSVILLQIYSCVKMGCIIFNLEYLHIK